MRWLAWTMLMAIAAGAGAAGVNSELNPVRTHPHGNRRNPGRGGHRQVSLREPLRTGRAGPTGAGSYRRPDGAHGFDAARGPLDYRCSARHSCAAGGYR